MTKPGEFIVLQAGEKIEPPRLLAVPKVKTLDALKAAVLRLEKVEKYQRMVSDYQRFDPYLTWSQGQGWDGYDEMRADVAAMIAPTLPGLMQNALENARAKVAELSRQVVEEIQG